MYHRDRNGCFQGLNVNKQTLCYKYISQSRQRIRSHVKISRERARIAISGFEKSDYPIGIREMSHYPIKIAQCRCKHSHSVFVVFVKSACKMLYFISVYSEVWCIVVLVICYGTKLSKMLSKVGLK